MDRLVAATGPVGNSSGPECVPRHVISMQTVLPLANAPWIVAFESGKARAQPCQQSMTWSMP